MTQNMFSHDSHVKRHTYTKLMWTNYSNSQTHINPANQTGDCLITESCRVHDTEAQHFICKIQAQIMDDFYEAEEYQNQLSGKFAWANVLCTTSRVGECNLNSEIPSIQANEQFSISAGNITDSLASRNSLKPQCNTSPKTSPEFWGDPLLW